MRIFFHLTSITFTISSGLSKLLFRLHVTCNLTCMPLIDIELDCDTSPVPEDVHRYVVEAERRIEAFQRDSSVPGFVGSNLDQGYRALRAIMQSHARPGALFCEWGCGFGAVACLASMVGFHAVGIEIEPRLVQDGKRLAAEFDLPVEFVIGSFLPSGSDVRVESGTGFSWLKTEESPELPFDPDDFDVIYAYPWPAEEDVTAILFERYAAPNALLLSFLGNDDFRLRRKIGDATRKRRRPARRNGRNPVY